MRIININSNSQKILKNNLKKNSKYYFIDNKNKCFGIFFDCFESKLENRYIFKDVKYFNKKNININLLSTTQFLLSNITKIDFGLPDDLQKLIEDYL